MNFFLYIFRTPINIVDEKALTVVFHAILSKRFDLDVVKKIVIRGEGPIFKGTWEKGGVPVTMER